MADFLRKHLEIDPAIGLDIDTELEGRLDMLPWIHRFSDVVKLKALVYALRVEKPAPDEPVPML